MTRRILIVEDDELVCSLIALKLEKEGYEVTAADLGRKMFERLEADKFDLVILDLGLPDEDGIVLARKLRARSSVPLMILTGRRGRDDRLAGLGVGADEYMLKSDSLEEFLLRVRNLMTRHVGQGAARASAEPSGVLSFRGWTMNLEGYDLVAPSGEHIQLTPREFTALSHLATNAGRVLSRASILDAISGYDEGPTDRMVDTFISRIRKKIEKNPKKPEIILTVSGVGYKLDAGTG